MAKLSFTPTALPSIEALLNACNELHGSIGGIPSSAYMRAQVLVCYAAALRPSDVRDLRWENITAAGKLAIVERKTGVRNACQLNPQTMEALAAIRDESRTEQVFPGSHAAHIRIWRLLARKAGIDARLPHALRALHLSNGGAA